MGSFFIEAQESLREKFLGRKKEKGEKRKWVESQERKRELVPKRQTVLSLGGFTFPFWRLEREELVSLTVICP